MSTNAKTTGLTKTNAKQRNLALIFLMLWFCMKQDYTVEVTEEMAHDNIIFEVRWS